ncbi:CHAD domain-containing protein [Candidatus Sumerlaeota bacterium]|nr:CHAD domain-containing protein [Candidatus Sumerlaeota bacterium]
MALKKNNIAQASSALESTEAVSAVEPELAAGVLAVKPAPRKIKPPKQQTNDFKRECAAVMIKQINTIFKYEPNLLDKDDIEPLHEMRVAINKLRNCMRYFPAFADRRTMKALKRECRHYKDALGVVRDFDVTLAEFNKLKPPKTESLQAGIEWAHATILADREAPYNNLVKETHLLRYEEFKRMLADYRELCVAYCDMGESRRISREDQFSLQLPKIFQRLRRLYYERREQCEGNFDMHTIHALRLGGKRIRYTLEFFMQHRVSLYRPMRKVIKAVHDTTGEMHDVDVILPYFEARYSDLVLTDPEKARLVRPGFMWVIRKYIKKREKYMLQFTRQWALIHSGRFEKRMERICAPWNHRRH